MRTSERGYINFGNSAPSTYLRPFRNEPLLVDRHEGSRQVGRHADQVIHLLLAAVSQLLKYAIGQHAFGTKLCPIVDEFQERVFALLTDAHYILDIDHHDPPSKADFQTHTNCRQLRQTGPKHFSFKNQAAFV